MGMSASTTFGNTFDSPWAGTSRRRFRSIAIIPAIMLVPVLAYIAHPQIADFFEQRIIPAQEAELFARFDQPRLLARSRVIWAIKRREASRIPSGWNCSGVSPARSVWAVRRGKDGSEDETAHQVTLTKGFWMGRYELTQGSGLR